jgi:pSer/pThr/pTyr-binding forkhead associated (FHA) protein
MYRLTLQNRDASRPLFTGGDTTVVIGRDPKCAVRLTDGGISDRHAQIERRPDGYYLRELDSANGVRLNGQPVTEQRLTTGDEIELGAVGFKFEVVHEPPPERRAFDPLQATAILTVTLLVAGQLCFFFWIFQQPHPRKGHTDIERGRKHLARETNATSNTGPDVLPPLPATEPTIVPPAPSEVLNRMLRVTRIDRSDAADSVTLRLQIKAQVSELHLEPGNIAIGVQFFSLPNKPGSAVWLNIPADWENFSSRTFTVKFTGPPSQLAGYVVRTYYRKKLQDVSATPPSIAQSP